MKKYLTLQKALETMRLDEQKDIPLIVRLLENPQSPLALPGKISLFGHDCLHILLGIGTRSLDEAFLVGFTMGNDLHCKNYHVVIFKFFAKYLYPRKYRFSQGDLSYFAQGFQQGRKFPQELGKIDFQNYLKLSVARIRQIWGINRQTLLKIANVLRV